MTFGVTPTGFVPKTTQDILTSLRAYQRANIDPNWEASDESLEGQINASVAVEIATVWEQLDFVFNQYNPDDAEGTSQDMICSLTGTMRLKAEKSTVVVNLVCSAATTWPAGTLIAQENNETNVWSLDADVVAGAAGTYQGNFTNQNFGPIEGPTGTLTVKISSVPSWDSCTNPADATVGRNVETDTELAIRREEELRALGGASEPAITASIEETFAGIVRSVHTLENEGDTVDGNGLPPHSFECIIWDPAPEGPADNDALAQEIWNEKALGIQTNGNTGGTAKTKAGESKVVYFSRPVERVLHISISITVDSTFPTDGDQQVKTALKTLADQDLVPGMTVYLLKYRAESLKIQGVINSPTLLATLDGPPVGTIDIPISVREIASLDTSNITVTHV